MIDEPTKAALSRYLKDVRALPNEAAKTHRFAGLVSELFPGTRAPTELAAGVEKLVRIPMAGGTKRGRIDAYYANTVIEFENSLKATEAEAQRQLRKYVSGVWRDGDRRPLICVASDGVTWKSFRPRLKGADRDPTRQLHVAQPATAASLSDIELVPFREIVLSEKTLDDFWIWLTNVLFREQTEPTVERFRVGFGAASLAFSEAMEALHLAWRTAGEEPEVQLAFDTWKRYLTLTYGSLTGAAGSRPELETLFLKHTYLASVARLLIWAELSRGVSKKPLREVADDVLSGRYFHSQGMENLVEDDFFQWIRNEDAAKILTAVWERILAQFMTYDLSRLDQDVLKGLYQELVDPRDRHDLGEYYTPEWLCERIVEELLPKEGFVSVLDPTCGSGSFLRAAIAHLLRANPNGGDVRSTGTDGRSPRRLSRPLRSGDINLRARSSEPCGQGG